MDSTKSKRDGVSPLRRPQQHTTSTPKRQFPTTLKITGYSPKVSRKTFSRYLTSYGKIRRFYFSRDFTTIQYENDNVAKRLVERQLKFSNVQLKVEIATRADRQAAERGRDETDSTVPLAEVIKPELIVDRLKAINNFEEQIAYIMEELPLPLNEIIEKYTLLCQHLQTVLSTSFKGCQAMPFGSTVTGLALKGSDLDVFIFVPHVERYKAASSSLSICLINESKKFLYRRPDLFKQIVAITKAKTPIIKCIHKVTGINCDINFKNMLGVCNSNLINFLLNLDPRLRTLMIIIKYWAKINDLTGPGKFTNYSLVMLVVFYLQTVSILPPISILQTPGFNENIVDGWNAGFNMSLKIPIINKDTIPELLLGFFEFYMKYEFAMKVISPLIANDILKTNFSDIDKLDAVFWRYQEQVKNANMPQMNINSYICVQDPFELNHNLTKSVTILVGQHFQECCTNSAQICKDTMQAQDALLPRLFGELTTVSQLAPPQDCTEIVILPRTFLDEHSSCSEDVLRKKWFERANEVLLLILIKVFKFDLNLSKNEHQNKAQKTEDSQDVHDNDYIESFNIICTGYYAVFVGRKKVSKIIQDKNVNNGILHEIMVSDYLIDKYYNKNASNRKPILELSINFSARVKPTRIVLNFTNTNPKLKSYVVPFLLFMKRWLPSWLEKFAVDKEDDFFKPISQHINFSADSSPSTSNVS